MFQLKRTTKNIDIYASGRPVNNGWVSITIDKGGIVVYISKDKTRAYWIGRTEGQSAKLAIKFDDTQHKITINKSNRIVFHNAGDYSKLKEKTIYYKHMKEGENGIIFS